MSIPKSNTKNNWPLFENILFDVRDRVGIITINRPKFLNALSPQTLREFYALIVALQERPEIGALVITGSGDKAFVAGADIAEFTKLNPTTALSFAALGQKAFTLLEELKVPVIAAVNGYALGGGCELALACDFIYASSQARFGQPEVNLGIIPGFGGTQRLSRLVGKNRAAEMIYTGQLISAEEALRIGLVNKVCPPDKLMEEVLKTAQLILKKGPIAIQQAKRAIYHGLSSPLSSALELESQAFALLFGTEDQKEGAQAFLEKREPTFRGH